MLLQSHFSCVILIRGSEECLHIVSTFYDWSVLQFLATVYDDSFLLTCIVGIWAGMHTVRYFDGRTYHWVSLSQQPNIINKVCLQHLPSHYVVNENISVQFQPFFGLIWFLGWIIQEKRFDRTIFLVITHKNYTYWVLLWWSKSFIMGPPKIILEFLQIFQHYGNWSVVALSIPWKHCFIYWVECICEISIVYLS